MGCASLSSTTQWHIGGVTMGRDGMGDRLFNFSGCGFFLVLFVEELELDAWVWGDREGIGRYCSCLSARVCNIFFIIISYVSLQSVIMVTFD